ncbi:unnamed protein product, partial [Chrysoparadoxa australica]
KILLVSATILAFPIVSKAEPLPADAQPASREVIEQTYSGFTEIWAGDCRGGIFFFAGGETHAWCAKSPSSFAVGSWWIEDGGMHCRHLLWYYRADERVAAEPEEPFCLAHSVSPGGQLWRQWPDDREWWLLRADKEFRRGDLFLTKVQQARKRLGF